MKKIPFIFSLFLFIGCTDIEIDDLITEHPVLNAVFEQSKKPQQIRYFEIPLIGQSAEVFRPAVIRIIAEDNSAVILNEDNNVYSTQEDFIFQSGLTYRIEVKDSKSGAESFASVTIPPAIQVLIQEMDTIHLSDPGNQAGLLQWNSPDPNKYSFSVRLENLEENPVLINQNPSGLFQSRFEGPQLEPFLSLFKSDFLYQGHHRLTVVAIDREFEAMFFFDAADLRGILQNGPDNVMGGNGFVTGVSSFAVDLWIED